MNIHNKVTFLTCTALLSLLPIEAFTAQHNDKSVAESLPTVINITAPNSSGLSHNPLTQFNVAPAGLILNNAPTTTETHLAGSIAGNPNLQNGPATVILTEVTSHHPSQLQGMIEVAGKSAHVIIANPSGISCNGCGFINTPHASLITAVPHIGSNGRLEPFQLGSGSITIAGKGLQGQQVDQLDLISQAVTINAQLWGQKINIITHPDWVFDRHDGHNDKFTQEPLLSVDGAAMGGMYAQRIQLIGTPLGVGVNHPADLATNNAVQLDHNGRLTTDQLFIQTHYFNNKGSLSAAHFTLHADAIVNGIRPDSSQLTQQSLKAYTVFSTTRHPGRSKTSCSASGQYPQYPSVALRYPSLQRFYDKQQLHNAHPMASLKTAIKRPVAQQNSFNKPGPDPQAALPQGEIRAGKLLLKANSDLHHYGVMTADHLELAAGRDLHIVGGSLLSKKSMQIKAQRHLTLQGATLMSQGEATLLAQGRLTVGAQPLHSLSRPALSSIKLSRLRGQHITLHSHQDLVLNSSQIISQQSILMSSNANLFSSIQAQNMRWQGHNTIDHPVGWQELSWKKLLLGRLTQHDQRITTLRYPIGNTIESLASDVTLQTRKKILLQGIRIKANNNIILQAQDMLLQDSNMRLQQANSYRQRQRGINLTLNSPIVDAHDSVNMLSKAIQYAKRPDQRSLALLQGSEGLLNGWQTVDNMQSTLIENTHSNPLDLFKFNLGLYQRRQQNRSYQQKSIPVTNKLQAGNDIRLVTTAHHQPPIGKAGNIYMVGGYLTAKQINLKAQRDLLLQALPYQNEIIKRQQKRDRQGGVHLVLNPILSGTGLFAEANNKQDQEQISQMYNSNSQLLAQECLTLHSGRDLYLMGAEAKGDRVVVTSQHDLLLTSPAVYHHSTHQQRQKIGNATVFPTLT